MSNPSRAPVARRTPPDLPVGGQRFVGKTTPQGSPKGQTSTPDLGRSAYPAAGWVGASYKAEGDPGGEAYSLYAAAPREPDNAAGGPVSAA
jgi:hypothetical protein